jgi:CRP-like cAMP-binding protein
MNATMAETMTTFDLFRHFTSWGTQDLIASGEIQQYDPGDMLIVEREPPDFVLLLMAGSVVVFVNRDNQEFVLTEHKPGALLGEIGVLANIPRTASVRATEPSTVVKWDASVFWQLVFSHRLPWEHIFRQLLRQLIDQEQVLIDVLVQSRRP